MKTKSKKEETMNTEIVKKETQEVGMPIGAWGGEAVSATDVLIPKVLLMQSLSEHVVEGDAGAGDLVDSVSGEVLLSSKAAKEGKTFEVIPITMFKTVVIERFNGQKWEYVRTQPYSIGDEKKLWEFEEDGQKFRGNVTLNFYILRADQVNDPSTLPYVVSFRRTSTKAGKFIATHFMKCNMAKIPPAAKTILIGSKSEKSDNGPYQVFTAADGNKTDPAAIKIAYGWFQQINQGLTKVDESEDKSSESPIASVNGPAF